MIKRLRRGDGRNTTPTWYDRRGRAACACPPAQPPLRRRGSRVARLFSPGHAPWVHDARERSRFVLGDDKREPLISTVLREQRVAVGRPHRRAAFVSFRTRT